MSDTSSIYDGIITKTSTDSQASSGTDKKSVDVAVSPGIASKESKAINRLRLLVLLVLLTAGTIVCILVYRLSMSSVYEQFSAQYQGQAEQIALAFQRIPLEKFGSLGALRLAIMAEADDKNVTWPFYYMSSFEKRSAVARRLSETLNVNILPLVADADRTAFEEYAAKVGPSWL
jgi:hypothetical protein